MKSMLLVYLMMFSLGVLANPVNMVYCSYEGENVEDESAKIISMVGVMCLNENSHHQQCQQPMRPQLPKEDYSADDEISYLNPGESISYNGTLYICGSSNISYSIILIGNESSKYELHCQVGKSTCAGTISISMNEFRQVYYQNPLNLSRVEAIQLNDNKVYLGMSRSELEYVPSGQQPQ